MWQFVVLFVVNLIVSYALRPRAQNAPPAGLNSINVPTAEEGRAIPVLFGSCIIEGPNCTWYGDLKTEAVKKKGGKK